MFRTKITTKSTAIQKDCNSHTNSSVQLLHFNLSDSGSSVSLSSLDFFHSSAPLYPVAITRTNTHQAPFENPMKLYEGTNPAYITNSPKPFLNIRTHTYARTVAKKLLCKTGVQLEEKGRKNIVWLQQVKQKIKNDVKRMMLKASPESQAPMKRTWSLSRH
jgi:hypothetical protein